MRSRCWLGVPLAGSLVVSSVGCAATPIDDTQLASKPLDAFGVHSIPVPASLGSVRTLSETPSDILVAGERAFALLEGPTLAVRASGSASLVAVAPTDLADATFVGVGSAGELFAIAEDARTVDIASRYGLPSGAFRATSPLGPLGTGFALADGYAFARNGEVTRVTLADVREVFPCHSNAYVRTTSSLYRLDATGRPAFVTPFPSPIVGVVCDERDRVVAMSATTLWRERDAALAPVFEERELANLVRTRDGVAFTSTGALCTLVEEELRCAAGNGRFSKLFSSLHALPYALSSGGVLVALAPLVVDAGTPGDGSTVVKQDAALLDASSLGDASSDANTDASLAPGEVAWTTRVKPIAERACFGCHGTVGAASVSLTSYGAWVTNRNALRQRVVTLQNMPPNASNLTSAERSVLAAWIDGNG